MEGEPNTLGGRYVLLRTIGLGGMASVFAARDERLGADCAVKVLHPRYTPDTDAWRRFMAEARTMARIRHPNLVSVLDVGEDGGRAYLVMQLVEGGSLAERIEALGPLPVRLACRVIAGALAGLSEAHAHGVVHRDIKPDNLLFSRHGEVMVGDFGIARDPGLGPRLTRTEALLGTPAFMPPEQRMSTKGVGTPGDVYCAGATLLCALKGQPAIVGIEYPELQDELYRDIDPRVAAVIQRATRFRPEDRFEDAAKMREALLALEPELPEDPPDTVPLGRLPERSGRPEVPVPVALAGGTAGHDPAYAPRLSADRTRALERFVPRRMVLELARQADATGFAVHRFDAIVLLAEGAGDAAIGRLVERIDRRGGEIVELAGESVLAVWRAGDGEDRPLQALACARELVGIDRTVRVAVTAGPAAAVRVGGRGGRWSAVLTGPAREAIAELLPRAAAGDVVVQEALRVEGESDVPLPAPLEVGDAGDEAEAYLSRPTLHRLAQGLDGWTGEPRSVTVLCARVEGLGADDAGLRALHEAVGPMQEALDRWSGSLVKVSSLHEGGVLVASFGLTTGGAEVRPAFAARAAVELHHTVRELGHRCSVGVATGSATSGLVGSSERCEHVLVGAPVRLAARLMRGARGGVVCDQETHDLAGDDVAFAARGSGLFEVYPAAGPDRPSERPLMGRQELLDALEPVLRSGSSRRLALLSGEAGSGKTAILRHLERRARGTFHVSGDPLQVGAPYGALRRGLERLLGAGGDHGVERLGRAHPDLAERASLLNDVLGSHAPETSATADLHDFLRAEATVELVVELVRRELGGDRDLVVVDDGQWVDASSWAVVRALLGALPQVPVVVATRTGMGTPDALQALLDEHPALCLDVPRLDRRATRELVRHVLGTEPAERVLDWILARTGGQPLFVVAVANTLREAEVSTLDTQALDELAPPPTLEGAVAWRLDKLDEATRLGVGAASALGMEFHPKVLQAVHPLRVAADEIARQLASLVRSELCQAARDGRYQFVLPLVREVAYRSLREDQRFAVHREAARHLAASDAAPSLVAFHHLNAGEPALALDPLERAADLAHRSGAVAETHRFLTDLVDLDRQLRDRGEGAPLARRAGWLRRLADCAAALGRPDEARGHAEAALRALGTPVPASDGEWRSLMLKELMVHLSHRLMPDLLWRHGPEGIVQARERARSLTRLSEAFFFLAGSRMALLGSTLAAVNEAERCLSPACATSAIGTLAMVANTLGLRRAAGHYLATTLIGATASNPRDLAVAWFSHVMVHAPRGEWEEAEAASSEALPLLRRSQNRFMLGPLLSVNALNDTLRGRYDRAVVWAEELARDRVIERHQAWGQYNEANVALLRGDAEHARELAAAARDLLVRTGDVSRITADGLLAVAQMRCGSPDAARETARDLIDRLEQDPLSSYTRLEGYAGPAEVYAELLGNAAAAGRDASADDTAQAARALTAMKRYARRYVLGQPRYWLLRGLIEAASGSHRRAHGSLERARDLARSLGLPCDEARALAGLARVRPDGAAALLQQAEQIFSRIGCSGFLDDLRSSQRALDAA